MGQTSSRASEATTGGGPALSTLAARPVRAGKQLATSRTTNDTWDKDDSSSDDGEVHSPVSPLTNGPSYLFPAKDHAPSPPSGHSDLETSSAAGTTDSLEDYWLGSKETRARGSATTTSNQGSTGRVSTASASRFSGERRAPSTGTASMDRGASRGTSTDCRSSVERRQRTSMQCSDAAAGGTSEHTSSRSSFARERISLDVFRPLNPPLSATGVAALRRVPAALFEDCAALAIVPPNTPVPMVMLELLWANNGLISTRQVVHQLELLEILRTAELDDGSTWCLVAADHQRLVQEERQESGEWPAMMRRFHCGLLDRYSRGGEVPLHKVVDDGYFMQQVTHHLAGAGRLTDLRALLSEPDWVEAKLHAYGIAAIVADFRRYLQLAEEGSDVKLLLQAFQLSLSGCMEHPACHMLREQMLARLMTVAKNGKLQEWHAEQTSRVAGEAMLSAGRSVVHLMPRTATLQQAGGLHRMTLRGHAAAVRGVVISPNGQDVITIGDDGAAQVFDMNVGDSVMQLSRSQPLTAVAVTPDGRLCVMAGADGACAIWELATGKVAQNLLGHTAKVNAVAIDREGRRCVTVSDDASMRVWSLPDGACLQALRGHGSVSSAILGVVHDVAICADGGLAATASVDCTVRVWDLDQNCCLNVLEGHAGGVMSVTFIGSSRTLITASRDTTARVWDAHSGVCLHVLAGHEGTLNKVCVDHAGLLAVTCSDDMTSRVWQLSTGACLQVLRGHSGWVSDAAITRDGRKVVTVSGDHMGAIWDVATGACDNVLEGHSGAVGSVVLTHRGRFAVTASEDCTARVWDLQAASTNLPMSHEGKIKSLQALEGGTCVVSVAEDGKALVWDAVQGIVMRTIAGHTAPLSYLATQDHGDTFVTGSSDRQLCLWSAVDGSLIHKLAAQQGSRVKSMAVDGAGTTAVVVLYDSTLGVWDLRSGQCLAQLTARADRDPARVHSGAINAAILTRDGSTVVTISKDCTARVWDVAAGACRSVIRGHTDAVVAVALSHDETMLATGCLDHSVHISKLSDGSALAALDHPGPVTELVFSPDGRHLAALVESRRVVVWDLLSRTCCASLVGHKGDVAGVVFSPNSRLLATFSADCTVRVWRAHSGEPVAFFCCDAAVTSVCFAGSRPASDILAVGDNRGVVHFLDFPTEVQQPAW